MKLTRGLLATLAVSLLSVSAAAHADTFNFSFGTTSDPFSGKGTLTGELMAPGQYLITAVTGTTDTGNGTNRTIAGLEAPGNFEGNDNLLFVTGGVGMFDNNGFSYYLGNGAQINVFSSGSGSTGMFDAEVLERSGGNFVYGFAPYTVTAATPEPGSFLLLGTGLLGAVGAARRRLLD